MKKTDVSVKYDTWAVYNFLGLRLDLAWDSGSETHLY